MYVVSLPPKVWGWDPSKTTVCDPETDHVDPGTGDDGPAPIANVPPVMSIPADSVWIP
jgi:hypothetical protein